MTGGKADAVIAVLMNQKLNKIILKSNLHVKQGLKLGLIVQILFSIKRKVCNRDYYKRKNCGCTKSKNQSPGKA